MEISFVTEKDLISFKDEILNELQKVKLEIIEGSPKKNEVKLLKSHQVQRLMSISAATLQNLRSNGTIPFSKVGGVIFYDKNEIMQVIEDSKRNGK
ncbi:MAG: helix-turn-helix domain-containing protein [Brumimicrobium sp.]